MWGGVGAHRLCRAARWGLPHSQPSFPGPCSPAGGAVPAGVSASLSDEGGFWWPITPCPTPGALDVTARAGGTQVGHAGLRALGTGPWLCPRGPLPPHGGDGARHQACPPGLQLMGQGPGSNRPPLCRAGVFVPAAGVQGKRVQATGSRASVAVLSGVNALHPGPWAHLWDTPSYQQGSANPVSKEVAEGTAQRREGTPQDQACGLGRLPHAEWDLGTGVSRAPDAFPGRSVQSIRGGWEGLTSVRAPTLLRGCAVPRTRDQSCLPTSAGDSAWGTNATQWMTRARWDGGRAGL